MGQHGLNRYLELLVNLLGGPVEPHAVLGHLESTDSHASSVGSLQQSGGVSNTIERCKSRLKETV